MAEPAPHSVLSDGTIRRLVAEGRLRIEPWDDRMVQPASVDLKLGASFRVFHNHRIQAIDLADPPTDLTEHVAIAPDEPFVIHPGEFVLGRTEEHVVMPADLVARIEGKALALDTEVPTPDGWRTMGDLKVGDHVFDQLGTPRRVVAATDVLHGRECFRVRLSDGTEVVADAQHQWATQTKYERRIGRWPAVRTTERIRETLRQGNENNHLVQDVPAVRYAARDLPIDPYVLGVWIGDGTSTTANLTTADPPILEELELAGVRVTPTSQPLRFRIGGAPRERDAATGRFTANASLHAALRALGVLGDKHLPDAYLQASPSQRLALLQGLMDTDGYVDTLGRCELTTVKRHLADQYCELLASLGFKPKLAEKRAMLDGRDCGPQYEVHFTPHHTVFRLPRKQARQKLTSRFKFGRTITAVDPVPSVPVRCIEVDAPDGLFLVTRRYVPTHNSSLGRLGLIVHATAGFVDPGFAGTLTLEITNFNSVPIVLRPGLPVAQLSLMALDRPAERPYGHPELGSHYHGQVEATESRYEGGPGAPRRDSVG